MYQITAWRCKYCGAIKGNEKIMENHERACLSNPNAINCLLCTHRIDDDSKDFNHCSITGKKCSKALSSKCQDFERK